MARVWPSLNFSCFHPVAVNCAEYFEFGGYSGFIRDIHR